MSNIANSSWFIWLSERFVPVASITLITLPIWLSPFHPAIVAYLVLAYIVYFSYKSIRTIYYAWISFAIFERSVNLDWQGTLEESEMDYSDVIHVALITNAIEPVEIVDRTVECLQNQTFPVKQTIVLLALEKRFEETAKARADFIKKKYRGVFKDIIDTYHPLLPGEVVGKASNAAFAAKELYEYVQKKGLDPKKVVVTVMDTDSQLHHSYYSCLTYKYLKDAKRDFHFFAAPVLLYNHFWALALPVRLQTIISSVLRLSLLPQERKFIQISTYSCSIDMLHRIGYWDTDIIPEDWHIHLQAFYTLGAEVQTIPIYLPIVRDGVYAPKLMKALQIRYQQEKRWAWGASDISYALRQSLIATHVPLIERIKKLSYISETHILWPTSFFLLTISGWIPTLVHPTFERTVLGYLLPRLSSALLTMTTLLLFLILYFDFRLRNYVNIKTDISKVPLLFIQWYFLPIISFLFSSLPALDTHVRLLLGKKIEYKVTAKVK